MESIYTVNDLKSKLSVHVTVWCNVYGQCNLCVLCPYGRHWRMINDTGKGDSEMSSPADAPTDNIVSFIANDLLNICTLSNSYFSL